MSAISATEVATLPPPPVVCPSADEQENGGLERKADTIRQQDDGVDCEVDSG